MKKFLNIAVNETRCNRKNTIVFFICFCNIPLKKPTIIIHLKEMLEYEVQSSVGKG